MAGKKITGRTKQLSLKSTPEFHKELKSLATEQKCLMIEILERSFGEYKEKLIKQKTEKETIQKLDKPFIPQIEVSQISQIRVDKRPLADDAGEEQNTNSKKRKIGDY